ncbi:MAG: nuclear transport factor 2 family protein [Kaistella sp.]|nr:nuclear transport factor 2 family protein [Kaistella sp.]
MDCKITAFMQDLNTKNTDNLKKWFNDESQIWIPPSKEISGANRILALFRAIFRRYENIVWEISTVHDLGNHKFFYETVSQGFLSGKGFYKNNIATVVQFSESGKIVHLSDYFKNTEVFN